MVAGMGLRELVSNTHTHSANEPRRSSQGRHVGDRALKYQFATAKVAVIGRPILAGGLAVPPCNRRVSPCSSCSTEMMPPSDVLRYAA